MGSDPTRPTAEESAWLAYCRETVADRALAARRALADRDAAIVDMRAAGGALRDIAEAAAMAHGSVVRILRRAQ
jgi:hypothetical protein